MKRCPQCGRTYSDDSMSFCLDDGSELLFGPANWRDLDESQTAILKETGPLPGAAPRAQIHTHTTEKTRALPSSVAVAPKNSFDKRLIAAPVLAVIIVLGVYVGSRSVSPSVKQI